MSYQLRLEKDAIIDIQQAFAWYEEQKTGLGFFFLEELEICYQKICNNPQYYTAINEWFRRIKIDRFPYLVIYEIDGNLVIVNAIRHTSRNVIG